MAAHSITPPSYPADPAISERCVQRQRGFTMIELVATMVIIGIMAFAALPRFNNLSAFDARGVTDQLTAYLRYAQKSALAQRRYVTVTITNATTAPVLTVGNACSSGTTLTFPVTFARPKSTVNLTISGTQPICFDTLGGTSAATQIQVRDSANALASTLTVENVTGYVHAN